jgi:hypothetical protein
MSILAHTFSGRKMGLRSGNFSGRLMLNIHGDVPFALPMTQDHYACEMQAPRKQLNLERERTVGSQSLRAERVHGISGLDLMRYA